MIIILLIVAMNLNPFLNPHYKAFFEAPDREVVVYGGAGAGKSYSIADKLLLQSIWQSDQKLRILLVRKTLASLKRTSLYFLETRAEKFSLPFDVNRQDWTAQCNNLTFLMSGMNTKEDYQKIKSMTDIDYIWINETTELRESDYAELLLRLRGEKRKDGFRQIISDFNPIDKHAWPHVRFFEKNIGTPRKMHFTVDNNPWAEKEYIAQLDGSTEWDENYHRIFRLGLWGELSGIIFNWDIVDLPDIKFDEIFFGGDFGYSVNPAALVRVYRKANEYWVQHVIYSTGLTNQQLGERMAALNIEKRKDISYWDSAEPKSIQELCDMGFVALPAQKGPDSVRAGIDYLKSLKIHIIDGSEDIIKEVKSYVWKKDKDGKPLNVPKEFDDHAISAIRYAIYTHAKQPQVAHGYRMWTGGELETAWT